MRKVIFLVLCVLLTTPGKSQSRTEDSISIYNTIHALEQSWNNNDMDSYCNLFAEDGSWISIGGLYWKDRSQVSKAMHMLAPVFKMMIPQELKIEHIQFLNNESAVVFILETIYVNQDWSYPNGEKGGTKGDLNYGQMSIVLTRSNDRWIIRAGHNTTLNKNMEKLNPLNK